MSLAHPEMDRHHFLLEWWPLIWQRYASWLIGEEIPVLVVEFPHARSAPAEDYARVFSSDCRFLRPSPDACLSFDGRYLARRVIRRPGDVQELVSSAKSIDLVSVPGIEKTLKSRIKAELYDHFYKTQQFLSMERIAADHCMSSQTLRRRLEEEGVSYRQVKEEIRREVVMKWLLNGEMPIGEVSRMGGFAEANGLTRAVKAWTGLSPKAYRNQALHAQA
jgi:AraC-like DNA-binding protein